MTLQPPIAIGRGGILAAWPATLDISAREGAESIIERGATHARGHRGCDVPPDERAADHLPERLYAAFLRFRAITTPLDIERSAASRAACSTTHGERPAAGPGWASFGPLCSMYTYSYFLDRMYILTAPIGYLRFSGTWQRWLAARFLAMRA